MTGVLFDIQRFCVHDGPGIRTAVFFKGCNLRCAWCHNPESFARRPEIGYRTTKCMNCGACISVCPGAAHEMADGLHVFRRELCRTCGACVSACAAGALSLLGRRYTVPEVLDQVARDLPYYQKSGGGVTFSGGEAAAQPDFLLALALSCRARGIHTCLETNGIIPPWVLSRLPEAIDLFLVDFKLHDAARMKALTRSDGEGQKETLAFLASAGKPAVLRCPVIPGVNEDDAFLEAALALKARHQNIIGIEFLPYHDLGAVKWASVGLEYPLRGTKAPDDAVLSRWRERARGAKEDSL